MLVTNAVAVNRLRPWNVARESRARPLAVESAGGTARARPSRQVWDNPILWRECRTRAYGRMIVVVRVAWLVLFAVAVAGIPESLNRTSIPCPL